MITYKNTVKSYILTLVLITHVYSIQYSTLLNHVLTLVEWLYVASVVTLNPHWICPIFSHSSWVLHPISSFPSTMLMHGALSTVLRIKQGTAWYSNYTLHSYHPSYYRWGTWQQQITATKYLQKNILRIVTSQVSCKGKNFSMAAVELCNTINTTQYHGMVSTV